MLTHFQENSILAFLYALFYQLQGMLQILPVNRILDLMVPTPKDRIGACHVAGNSGWGPQVTHSVNNFLPPAQSTVNSRF